MKNNDIVLVTGGSGMVGRCLQTIRPDWVYLSSKDADLRNYSETYNVITKYSPNIVIHLAANVGGLFKNMEQQQAMLYDNVAINMNVVKTCAEQNIRLIACLSTCIFPDKITYPITEDQLHQGPPHDSNYGYSYSKRMLEIACSTFPNLDYICIIPCNIFGMYDNFHLKSSHVVPALIHKAYLSKNTNTSIEIKGSGRALRQFVFAPDVAQIITRLVVTDTDTTRKNIMIAPDDEIAIQKLVNIIAKIYGVKYKFDMDPQKDGQIKKTSSGQVLTKLFPDFKFTSLEDGLKTTCEWFDANYNRNVRK